MLKSAIIIVTKNKESTLKIWWVTFSVLILVSLGCSGPTTASKANLICQSKGYELFSSETGFIVRNGPDQYLSQEITSQTQISSVEGIDWVVLDECNTLLIYPGSKGPEYFVRAPSGFPLKGVLKQPIMGAKNLLIDKQGDRLSIESNGTKLP